ncbi:MAG: rhodanese-like domain-containing protein [Hungatella sp.]|nr:rhodanese-like domain-containing protein [Hungatella sp.]
MMWYPTITMRELDNWILYGKNMYLVDLRNRDSFERCHLAGARNIPFEELEEHLGDLPVDCPVVFYCSRGSQSMLACNRLCDQGFQVVNAGGGLMAYRGRNLICSIPEQLPD